MRSLSRLVLFALAVSFGVLLWPAGPAWAADVKLSGTVTLNGMPLPSGQVLFHQENGQIVGSRIKDGMYTVDRVPVGSHKITIEAEGLPPKFSRVETTPLVAEIKKDTTTANLDLKVK
jgi:hypothetical protein